jgi:hypothetical protein
MRHFQHTGFSSSPREVQLVVTKTKGTLLLTFHVALTTRIAGSTRPVSTAAGGHRKTRGIHTTLFLIAVDFEPSMLGLSREMSPRRFDESVGIRTEVVGRTQLMRKAGLTQCGETGEMGVDDSKLFPFVTRS